VRSGRSTLDRVGVVAAGRADFWLYHAANTQYQRVSEFSGIRVVIAQYESPGVVPPSPTAIGDWGLMVRG